MKYFTFNWWRGMQQKGPHGDPAKQYRLHLDTIRHRLPADLLRIEGEVSLHDAVIHALVADMPAQELRIIAEGEPFCHAPPTMRLLYGGVASVQVTCSKEGALPGPGGWGHLGYWETDVVAGGYEHRFLFSSGIELHVVFSRFRLEVGEGPH